MLLFCVTSVPWTGNESAGDDVKNRTFNAQKNGQGELASRLSRLFLIVNAVINQKTQNKISCHKHFKVIPQYYNAHLVRRIKITKSGKKISTDVYIFLLYQ